MQNSNPRARLELFQTGDAFLVENAPRDAHWGIGRTISAKDLQDGPLAPGANWQQNKMGMILMAVRSTLRAETNIDARASKSRMVKSFRLYNKLYRNHPTKGNIKYPAYAFLPQADQVLFYKRIAEQSALIKAGHALTALKHMETRRRHRAHTKAR